MFDEFLGLALPLAVAGFLIMCDVPGLVKLIPCAIVCGVIWALFYVAKGFAQADLQ